MLALEFLGWEPPLPSAARFLAERFGPDLTGVVVALPGAHAGRRLGEHLARVLPPDGAPPRLLTAGQLTDELLRIEGLPAERMARTLAWAGALRAASAEELRALGAAGLEDEAALGPWLRLAERVRGLFGELGAEGLDFAGVAQRVESGAIGGGAARWRVLARVQERMEAALAAQGRVDPHLARRRAIESGARRAPRAVVLVAVQDMNGLLRRALEGLEAPVHALVPLPEERRDDLDAFGCLVPELVIERGLDLPLDRWEVASTPDAQARRALERIAGWNGRYRAEQITLGVADPEVVPFLRRRLASEGVRARDAAGTPLGSSLPARLLRALALYLARGRYADWATLLRHPDLEVCLRAVLDQDVVALVDGYQRAHLPDRVPEREAWLGMQGATLERLAAELARVLGTFAAPSPVARPLARWAAPLRALLENVYGERELDPEEEAQRELLLALRALGEALEELERLGDESAQTARGEEAIEFLLRALAGRALAPAPARRGEPTVELFGWLELALDDAPALVVTGFQDGLVPETVNGDAFLPDGLRRELGLLDNRRRLARDLAASELLLRTREEVVFVSGRWTGSGDPVLPSRIVFHGPKEGLVERVQRLDGGADEEPAATGDAPEPPRELPRVPVEPLRRIGVTAFRLWLESPYRFYLQRVLGLDVVDDAAREMDARAFGDLAHGVLEDFGRDAGIRDSEDAEAIHRFLLERLEARALAAYGVRPLAAVALQIDQLALRLRRFATDQARRRAEGWRIAHVEWEPADDRSVPRDVDGDEVRIAGRIDRIDEHPDGRWAIWDYKAGDGEADPNRCYVEKEGRWRDLQLPLYCLLASELGYETMPVLGYARISRDPAQETFRAVNPSKWDEERIASAFEAADEIVRAIRAEDLWRLGQWLPREDVFRDLSGLDLVAVAAGEASGDEDGEEEA